MARHSPLSHRTDIDLSLSQATAKVSKLSTKGKFIFATGAEQPLALANCSALFMYFDCNAEGVK
jgi:hypothetical protein